MGEEPMGQEPRACAVERPPRWSARPSRRLRLRPRAAAVFVPPSRCEAGACAAMKRVAASSVRPRPRLAPRTCVRPWFRTCSRICFRILRPSWRTPCCAASPPLCRNKSAAPAGAVCRPARTGRERGRPQGPRQGQSPKRSLPQSWRRRRDNQTPCVPPLLYRRPNPSGPDRNVLKVTQMRIFGAKARTKIRAVNTTQVPAAAVPATFIARLGSRWVWRVPAWFPPFCRPESPAGPWR
jgi:hypothetical protein